MPDARGRLNRRAAYAVAALSAYLDEIACSATRQHARSARLKSLRRLYTSVSLEGRLYPRPHREG
jgi:hypothetical protein